MSTAYSTISSGNLRDDWPEEYGSSGTLAIFCTNNFVADDGKTWIAGTGESLRGEFVTESAISVASSVATYAAFTLPTTDTSVPNTTRYYAILFDANGTRRDVIFENRHLRSTLGSSISNLQWANDNAQRLFRQTDTKPTTDDMNLAIAAALANIGADQDYALSAYASFAAAVTAVTATGGTLVINQATSCTTNTSVPANVTLRVTRKGSITVSNGVTLTLAQPPEAGPYLIFNNAFSGQGTVALPAFAEAIPDWWATNTTPGTTVMTSAVNAAMASGAATIRVDSNYRVGLVTIPSNIEIYGTGTFTQNVAGANVLVGTGLSHFIYDGPTIIGVPSNALESSNTGIQITNSTGIKIRNSKFQTLRYYPIELVNCSDVYLENNKTVSGSTGFEIAGVVDGWILNNDFTAPQYTGFNVGIKLDTGASTPNVNIKILGNKLQSWTNGQSILVHNGNHVTIDDNHMIDCLTGISINPYCVSSGNPVGCTGADVVNDIVVGTGNIHVGCNTSPAAPGVQNTGITIAGVLGNPVTNVVVTGGTYRNANVIGDLGTQGGINIGYADDVTIDSPLIVDCVAAGIALNNPTNGLVIKGFNIKNVVAASDTTQNGIATTTLGPHIGSIGYGRIDGVAYGMRFNVASPNLLIKPVDILNASIAAFRNPENAMLLLTGTSGDALTVSGNTITPLQTTHQVGAGLVKTITVPAGFVSGTIYLVPTAAYTYDATGNILGTGTAVVGRTMAATYNSVSSKWSMSY